jgi:Fe-S-cluster containining protein
LNPAKTIKYLRKQIPAFKRIPGCNACCGPVPFSKWEWAQIKDQRLATGITCPYASDKGCEIYEDRPILCRLMGTAPGLPCQRGCGPPKMLSREKELEIMRKYTEIMDK